MIIVWRKRESSTWWSGRKTNLWSSCFVQLCRPSLCGDSNPYNASIVHIVWTCKMMLTLELIFVTWTANLKLLLFNGAWVGMDLELRTRIRNEEFSCGPIGNSDLPQCGAISWSIKNHIAYNNIGSRRNDNVGSMLVISNASRNWCKQAVCSRYHILD